MKNGTKVLLGWLALALGIGFALMLHNMESPIVEMRTKLDTMDQQIKDQQQLLQQAIYDLNVSQANLEKLLPLAVLTSPENLIQLSGMRVHMYHPIRKECGNTPWTTSWGTKAKPMRTAAISRKLKTKLGVKFGDILIVDGHIWIIESNMAKRETAHFDLMYPIGAKQFRLLDATVHIIRVASAK